MQNFSLINDTFQFEQSAGPFFFFLIALIIGALFVHPVLQLPPSGFGVDASETSHQDRSMLPRFSPLGRRRTGRPPAPSNWPTLAKLRHPIEYLIGGGRRNRTPDSGAESEEFDRILDDVSDDDEQQRYRLFGKPRLRTRNNSHV